MKPTVCSFRGCGRPHYALGLCQGHRRQRREGRPLTPLRPYRPRSPNTVKFAGLRLSSGCAEALLRQAQAQDLSRGAAIAAVLEEWLRAGAKWPQR